MEHKFIAALVTYIRTYITYTSIYTYRRIKDFFANLSTVNRASFRPSRDTMYADATLIACGITINQDYLAGVSDNYPGRYKLSYIRKDIRFKCDFKRSWKK